MNTKKSVVAVCINRGQGNLERFTGSLVRESTTHYLVEWQLKPGKTGGIEWFAKKSRVVNSVLLM